MSFAVTHRAMGNLCSGGASSAAAEGKDNVRHKRKERVTNWKATGVVALRRASLTVRQRAMQQPAARLPVPLQLLGRLPSSAVSRFPR